MKKNSVLIISLCLSALIASCSQSEHKEEAKSEGVNKEIMTSTNENDIDKNIRATKKELEKKDIPRTITGKKSITLNGDKYIFTDEKLQKGSEVRHINMSEYGTVKGTFVVVAKAGESLDVLFKKKTKIAKDTFRLTPDQTDDLMTIYNELLVNKSIARVELEIVYSRKSSGVATY